MCYSRKAQLAEYLLGRCIELRNGLSKKLKRSKGWNQILLVAMSSELIFGLFRRLDLIVNGLMKKQITIQYCSSRTKMKKFFY